MLSRLPNLFRNLSSSAKPSQTPAKKNAEQVNFDSVFSFPFVKYIALANRLKVYHLYGSSVIIPSTGLMELCNLAPEHSFLIASYIGITSGAVLSLFTLPLKNVIGHLYLSEDNKLIKISSVGFSGKRVDRIVNVDEWTPLLDLTPKTMDAIYLRPQLTDGTKYKLFIKYGLVKDPIRMGHVLE